MPSITHGKITITQTMLGRICSVIEKGHYIKTACLAGGIREHTYYHWLRKAEEDYSSGEKTKYTNFKDRVEEAKAIGEIKLVNEIRDGDKGWQAKSWILERTRNQAFGQKQLITQEIELKPPQLPPQAPKNYKKWLERRLERNQLQQQATEAEFTEQEDSQHPSETRPTGAIQDTDTPIQTPDETPYTPDHIITQLPVKKQYPLSIANTHTPQ